MATWTIDPAHSEIHFKIKHLVISTVTGSFNKFEGTVESSKDDFTDAVIKFSADTASVDTGNDQRDAHLKAPDFFNSEVYPTISFQSTSVQKDGDEYTVTGNLTMLDVTKPVELEVEFGGIATDLYGQTKAGFEATGKINRDEFGLKWSAVTEAGGLVVSNDVKVIISVQLTKQA